MALRRATLPAWCAAAIGTGTRYSSVEIPNKTCTFAKPNAVAARRRVKPGSAARSDGANVLAYNTPVLR